MHKHQHLHIHVLDVAQTVSSNFLMLRLASNDDRFGVQTIHSVECTLPNPQLSMNLPVTLRGDPLSARVSPETITDGSKIHRFV